MKRDKIVAGNWKMNLGLDEGMELVEKLAKAYTHHEPRMVVIPPFLHALAVQNYLQSVHSPIEVGVQNCHQETKGAFTGEISASMIRSCRIPFVVLGHSERRQYFAETDALLAQKVKAALGQGLIPIYCVGEPLTVREESGQNDFVAHQLEQGLFYLSPEQFKEVVIAYEPIWAIGTGVTASPEQAQDMHAFIRHRIAIHYSEAVAAATRILYGGSVKGSNARDLFVKPDVDGALVGGASLDADDFLRIASSI